MNVRQLNQIFSHVVLTVTVMPAAVVVVVEFPSEQLFPSTSIVDSDLPYSPISTTHLQVMFLVHDAVLMRIAVAARMIENAFFISVILF